MWTAGIGELLQGRYAKQMLFPGIGAAGQERIARSTVTVVGLGALGTVIAGQLVRAGVGHLRIMDRDFVELSNLQRQTLFDEQDARERLPKAVAAAAHLHAANSEVEIMSQVADLTARNAEALLGGSDLVLDGTDNLETRFLLNDTCVKLGVPWVYGGAVGASGMTMTIVPGETPCLRCLVDHAPPPGLMPSCDTEGVLAATTGVVGSLQVAAALHWLATGVPQEGLLAVDVWEREFHPLRLERRSDCPCCVERRFEYLAGERTSWTTVLCGRNSVQIVPPEEAEISLEALQARLAPVGATSYNGFLLSVQVDEKEIVVFPTGRAIIRGTTDEAEARTLYARYVGN